MTTAAWGLIAAGFLLFLGLCLRCPERDRDGLLGIVAAILLIVAGMVGLTYALPPRLERAALVPIAGAPLVRVQDIPSVRVSQAFAAAAEMPLRRLEMPADAVAGWVP